MNMPQQDKHMPVSNHLLSGGDCELVQGKKPSNGVKANNAANPFVLLRETSEETIARGNQTPCPDLEHTTSIGKLAVGADKLLYEEKYGVRKAAELLGMGQTTLRAIVNNGGIPVIKCEGKLLFLARDLEEFLRHRYIRMQVRSVQRANIPALPAYIAGSPYLTDGGKS